MKILEDWRERQKKKTQEARKRDIMAEFQIKELDGYFYLTHFGVAIHKFDQHEYSGEMAQMLNETRTIAAVYDCEKMKKN